MSLIEITPSHFDVELSMAYATPDNFTEKPIYSHPHCYLHEDAASCLQTAITLAAKLQLRFKIFDAFRPIEAQQHMFNHTPDPEFLSNPETGAVPHCRGVAVDLTLVNQSGDMLDMGTGFDNFTSLSHHGNTEISTKAQQNRYLLMGIMTTAGWDFYRNEWWHYQLFNPRKYPTLSANATSPPMMAL